jgi:hypothetical protein
MIGSPVGDYRAAIDCRVVPDPGPPGAVILITRKRPGDVLNIRGAGSSRGADNGGCCDIPVSQRWRAADGAVASAHILSSMRVLPSVLGFTRSRSRNSATPSS